MFKFVFWKVVGNGILFWGELLDVVFDVEIVMNGCFLSYLEEDVELLVFILSFMLYFWLS